ncbi:MAG: hypothetical protein LEGION0403_FIIPPAGN_01514 [Legionella sp.]
MGSQYLSVVELCYPVMETLVDHVKIAPEKTF